MQSTNAKFVVGFQKLARFYKKFIGSDLQTTVIGEAGCFVNKIPTIIGKEFSGPEFPCMSSISPVRILTEKKMTVEFLKNA